MGIVNNYINKLLKFIKKENKTYEKPWHKYYDEIPTHINYYEGSIYDKLEETASEHGEKIAYKKDAKDKQMSQYISEEEYD